MYKNFSIKIIAILAVVAILGMGSYAFAGRGGGYGHHGYGSGDSYHGYGHHGSGRGYGSGCNYGENITQEEFEKLQAEHQAFAKNTENLRRNIYQKELALRSELAKENPDAQTALEVQKEISDLRAEVDQKRIDHLIKVREIAPNAGRGMMKGFGSRGGKGRGMGSGSGGGGRDMGSGSGGGPCWQ